MSDLVNTSVGTNNDSVWTLVWLDLIIPSSKAKDGCFLSVGVELDQVPALFPRLKRCNPMVYIHTFTL